MQNIAECTPSPFLTEIPSHLVEYHEANPELEAAEAEDFFSLMKSRFI
jgi:DNA helicase-2/ATP-dependent DNA helicase PcrA